MSKNLANQGYPIHKYLYKIQNTYSQGESTRTGDYAYSTVEVKPAAMGLNGAVTVDV